MAKAKDVTKYDGSADRLNTQTYYKTRLERLNEKAAKTPLFPIKKFDAAQAKASDASMSLGFDIASQNSWIQRGERARELALKALADKKKGK